MKHARRALKRLVRYWVARSVSGGPHGAGALPAVPPVDRLLLCFEYIDNDETVWERGRLTRLAHDSKLAAYRHTGFWHPMDTLRDRMLLEELWKSKQAPWKTWGRPTRADDA